MMSIFRSSLALYLCITLSSCALFKLPGTLLKGLGRTTGFTENQPQQKLRFDQSELKTGAEATAAIAASPSADASGSQVAAR